VLLDAVEIERLSAGAQVQHEASDDQSSEKLPNRQCREKRDGHREFHRHLSFRNVLEGFLENRIAADRGSRDAGYIDVRNCSNNYTPADALPVNWRRMGHTYVANYPEGKQGWMEAGFPVEKAA
jgi:hypothetical protein